MFFLIPFADENRTRKVPFITISIIIANCAVYVYQHWIFSNEHVFANALGLVPFEVTHLKDIVIQAPFTPYGNFFFYMFLHGGLFHICGNMLFLWIYGDNVEDKLGHFKFLIFYILCGIGAGLVQVLFGPGSKIPIVGASGAIAGVMGAYLRWFPKAKIKCLFIFIIFPEILLIPAVFILGFWILVQIFNATFLLGSETSDVAWFAHIGGFFAGFFYAAKLAKGKKTVRFNPFER